MSEPEKTENAHEPRVTKVDAVRQFVQMMKENDLTALDFIDGSTQIRLRRGSRVAPAPAYAPPPVYQAPPASQPAPAATATPAAPAAPAAPAGATIDSPMVGTFYSSSSPDAPSFVSVGAAVKADTTVCIIEAMKVFTDIPAGVSGTIAEVLVKNGQPVEFGQPLFRLNA